MRSMVKDETFQEGSAWGFQLALTSGFESVEQVSTPGEKEVNGSEQESSISLFGWPIGM